jgi:transcriptional regulator with XRE-family HTH domain
MPATQTRRKRKFGQALARLRNEANLTTEDAGRVLRRTASQISKIENGYNLCAFAELTALLVVYQASDVQRAEIETLWEDAKQDSTRIQGSSAYPLKFRAFLRNEADAATVSELQPNVIPGLLQTEDYAKAIMYAARRTTNPSIGVEKATAARLERQKLLYGADPLMLHALIDEGAIRRVVGGRTIMSRQLRHLVTIGQQDNITIQVIDFDAGAYGTSSGCLTILGFDDPEDPDAVYLEHPAGGEWVDSKDNIEQYKVQFFEISAQALSTAESAALITSRAEELEGL